MDDELFESLLLTVASACGSYERRSTARRILGRELGFNHFELDGAHDDVTIGTAGRVFRGRIDRLEYDSDRWGPPQISIGIKAREER